MMYRLDGKPIAKKVLTDIATEIYEESIKPRMVIIQVGNDPASTRYVQNKIKDAESVGIVAEHRWYYQDGVPATLSERESSRLQSDLAGEIERCSRSTIINGIIVQLPLPKGINVQQILDAIPWYKDVDGLSNMSIGRLHSGKYDWKKNEVFAPCTPEGVIELLWQYKIPIFGQQALVIGRSNLVGSPLARMLQDCGATVTVCHTKTPAPILHRMIRSGDYPIICTATGQKDIFKASECENLENVTLVDIGICFDEHGKMRGEIDVDLPFDENATEVPTHTGVRCTPVPGGIGLMTRALLLKHTLIASKLSSNTMMR